MEERLEKTTETEEQANGKDKASGKKKKIIISISAVLLVAILIILFFILKGCNAQQSKPTLIVEIPQKISLSKEDKLTLDVTITNFGEAKYPAFSSSISFDNSKLEFLGLEEGNVFVYNNATSGDNVKLPEFGCNPEQCNKSGMINVMYLDTTGGKNAFSKDLLSKEDNVVFRLSFRIKGSARANEVYDLIVEDAVFAASDENQSLATTQNTLNVKNGKIVIGE